MTEHTHLKSLGDGAFNPNAFHQETVVKPEAVERDWSTALATVQEAVKSFGATGAPSDIALQMRCEALWSWLKVDHWTPPSIALHTPPLAPVAPQPSATASPSATEQLKP